MSETSLPEGTLKDLLRVFAAYTELNGVVLYGSYATGWATSRSDIDMVTIGINDRYRLGRLILDLEDLPIPQKCDVQAYENIDYEPLKRHIDDRGITIYGKPAAQETP
jgi:predicted nucleotidyltransferase